MSECINILYEDDPCMDAYYYDFEPTGEKSVDAILSAVAWAGKGAHSTADWTEDWYGYGPCEEGQSVVEVIQESARRAAATLQRVREIHRPEPYTDEPTISYCLACQSCGSHGTYPCPTIRALDEKGTSK